MSGYGAKQAPTNKYGWGMHYSRPSQTSLGLMYSNRGLPENGGLGFEHYSFPSRDHYEPVTSSYPLRRPPQIKSFSPQLSVGGSPIHVYVCTDYDMLAPPQLICSLSFGDERVAADISRLESPGTSFEYLIYAIVPPFSETRASDSRVSLSLQLQEQNGQDAGLIPVGQFQYVSTDTGLPRKRKLSEGDQLSYSAYGGEMSSVYNPSARQLPNALARGWNPSYPNALGPQTSSLSSSSEFNPILVRTTTLHQSDNAADTAVVAAAGNAARTSVTAGSTHMYPQKATLKIHGDLNAMTEEWTPDEWNNKRRLVQFTRAQNKSTINVTFAPVAPEDRQPNSICISCIWWEERQECYATSVDTIQLLEQLVALRFTVEEKNRIRRNLEGFHPQTVSKTKAECEEFFKIIMAFPNPKPRNIEKDVKVFPWKVLGSALKKIISKYSASYHSSTSPPEASVPMSMSTPNPPHSAIFYASDSPGLSTPRAAPVEPAAHPSPAYSHSLDPSGSDSTHPSPNLGADYASLPRTSQHTSHPSSAAVTPATTSSALFSTAPSSVAHNSFHGPSRARSGSAVTDYAAVSSGRPFKRPRSSTETNALGFTHASMMPSNMSHIVHEESGATAGRNVSDPNFAYGSPGHRLLCVAEHHAVDEPLTATQRASWDINA